METAEKIPTKKLETTADKEIQESIRYYAKYRKQIPKRLAELEEEWGIERVMEMNGALIAMGGTLLGITVSKKYLVLPLIVTIFLAQYAVQGWCPPVSALRAFGFRTRKEIDKEKYALKALLGHFDVPKRSEEVWEAVSN
jgi:hypothetical protein